MKETEVTIPLSDSDLNIYGTLRGDYSQPLIILCHGYGGWRHEMIMYNGARYFEKEGFATLRLSMYGGGEKSRDISRSDVMTHANDIDDAVAFAQKAGAKWMGLAGHSYSGMAIVYSQKQHFQAAALWDPTHSDGYDEPESIENLARDFVYIDGLNSYVSGKGPGYVYAKTVFENEYPKSQEAAKQFHVPTIVINASWSDKQQNYGKQYANGINAVTEHSVIPNSTHPFVEDGAAEKLFAATSRFFKGQLQETIS